MGRYAWIGFALACNGAVGAEQDAATDGARDAAADAASDSPTCGNGGACPQAIVAANVQAATMGSNVGQACSSAQEFLYVPEASPIGPNTNTAIPVVTGTNNTTITCSIVPAGASYNVALTASVTGASAATFTVSGSFTPRSRDGSGNPNADSTEIPTITMDFLDATKHLRQTSCFGQYVLEDSNGQPAASLASVADTYADSNGGRIWVSVFCEDPQNLDETTKPGNAGCETSATFRFENCSSQ